MTDAVVVGNLLISLLRHADRVRGLPGAAGERHRAIRSEPGGPAWRQTIFHPFAQTAARAGVWCCTRRPAPEYETPAFGAVPEAAWSRPVRSRRGVDGLRGQPRPARGVAG